MAKASTKWEEGQMLELIGFDHFYVKPSDGKKEKRFKFLCHCGNSLVTSKRKVETGHTKSCGCLKVTHDMRNHELYNVWNLMVQRCKNTKFSKYKNYGGRGIRVCDEWSNPITGFSSFLAYVGERPGTGYTLERTDVDGNYCPGNVVWTNDNSLQVFNQTIRESNTSGKTGVSYDKSCGKWCATIRKGSISKKRKFSTFDLAAEQRDAWEIEFYGFLKK